MYSVGVSFGPIKNLIQLKESKQCVKVVLVGACRTAVGKFGGSIKDVPAVELGALVIKEALNRSGIKPEMVDEVILGCVLTGGWGRIRPVRPCSKQAFLKMFPP
jgi:acetyl-CoA acetyltransferase